MGTKYYAWACLLCIISFFVGRASSAILDHSQTAPVQKLVYGEPEKDLKSGVDLTKQLNAASLSKKPFRLTNALVIYAGECIGCSLHTVDPAKLPFDIFPEIIVIFQSPKEEVEKQAARLKGVGLVSDPDGHLSNLLNARWTNRWYIIRNGALLKSQNDPDDADWTKH